MLQPVCKFAFQTASIAREEADLPEIFLHSAARCKQLECTARDRSYVSWGRNMPKLKSGQGWLQESFIGLLDRSAQQGAFCNGLHDHGIHVIVF